VKLYLHSANTPSWRGAQLKKAERQLYVSFSFTFTSILPKLMTLAALLPPFCNGWEWLNRKHNLHRSPRVWGRTWISQTVPDFCLTLRDLLFLLTLNDRWRCLSCVRATCPTHLNIKLSLYSWFLFQKLTVAQLVKKLLVFMEHEVSLSYPQERASGHCPEPDGSNPHLPTLFYKVHSNIILMTTSTSSVWSLASSFSHKDDVRISQVSWSC
jgi:hypothetical protein